MGLVVREKTLLGNFFCFRMARVIAVKIYMLDMCEFSFDGMVFEWDFCLFEASLQD